MSSTLHSSQRDNFAPKTTDWINDLTYSDDENDSIWDLLEQNYSSPEGQEPPSSLNDSFPPQDQLFHPLARRESCASAISDEESYLAYSVSSIPGDEERANLSYGSIVDPFKKPGFRQAPSIIDRKTHVPVQNDIRCESKIFPRSNTSNVYHQLQSPLPTHYEESPLTSTTATDVTISPATEEEQRIQFALQQEAKQKLRRQKHLKKIRKAAETREMEVQRVRGVEQASGGLNDAMFGGLFFIQFAIVAAGALVFGPGALKDNMIGNDFEEKEDYNPFAGMETDDIIVTAPAFPSFGEVIEVHEKEIARTISHIDYVNLIQLVTIASGYASLCSLLTLGFMMMLAKNTLHVILIFVISASTICTILGVMMHGWIIPIGAATVLVISFIYTSIVWERILFAATNLSVALKGMKSALDIPLLGVCTLVTSFLWTIWCLCSFVGVFDFLSDCDQLSDNWMIVVVAFYLFSYCWTIQIIKVRYNIELDFL